MASDCSRLEWKGDALKRRSKKAQKAAINTTMAAAVLHAKANHGPGAHGQGRFETQSGDLERSIRIIEAAKQVGRAIRGRWGSIASAYARRRELGFQGQDSLGRVVNDAGHPYLFPAAREEYPKLPERLRREFARAS